MSPPPPPSNTIGVARLRVPATLARDVALPRMARWFDGRTGSRLRLAVDVIVLYLACGGALLSVSQVHSNAHGGWLSALFPIFVVAMLYHARSPYDHFDGSMLDAAANVVVTVSCATVLTIALDSLIGGGHPVVLALRLWLFASVCLGASRVWLLAIRRRLQRTGALSTPTLIIGAGIVGKRLVSRLTSDPRYGLRPVGLLDSNPLPRSTASLVDDVPVLGGSDDIESAIEQTGAKRVILAFSTEPDAVLVDKLRQCEKLGVQVSLVPRLYELINDRASLDRVGGLPLLSLHSVDTTGWQFAIKHALDRAVAFLALVILAPLLAAIALAVRLSSPGPTIFRQRRIGRDGREFDLFKFRTMRQATADTNGLLVRANGAGPGGVEGEDRRTWVGRRLRDLSLDELPQLLNVLRGDMSLVGPRPERPQYVAHFKRDVTRYDDRHRVKSGITGWAQVHGLRGPTSIADRVEWDNYYIQNWTLRLDMRILALTMIEVLRFREGG